VTGGQIAQLIEIGHLTIAVQKGVRRIIGRGGSAHYHPGSVMTLLSSHSGRRTGWPTERAKIDDAVARLRVHPSECDQR
jgi:hypothetical protein